MESPPLPVTSSSRRRVAALLCIAVVLLVGIAGVTLHFFELDLSLRISLSERELLAYAADVRSGKIPHSNGGRVSALPDLPWYGPPVDYVDADSYGNVLFYQPDWTLWEHGFVLRSRDTLPERGKVRVGARIFGAWWRFAT